MKVSSKKSGAKALLFLTIAVIIIFILMVISVRIEFITVKDEGLNGVSKNLVKAKIDYAIGAPYIFINTDKLKMDLEKEDPFLHIIDLHKVYPNTIAVTAAYRSGTALVPYGDNYLLLDKNCITLAYTDEPDLSLYPLVKGLEVKGFEIGEKLDAYSEYRLSGLISCLNALEKYKILEYISEILVYDFYDIKLITTSGITVFLGPSENMDQKIMWMAADEIKNMMNGVIDGELDLRYKEPVFRLNIINDEDE